MPAGRFLRDGFHHEDQLVSFFATEDDRGRVFRVRGKKGYPRPVGLWAAAATDGDGIADMNLGEIRFRHIESDLYTVRGQKGEDGRSRLCEFSGVEEDLIDAGGGGGEEAAVTEIGCGT